MSPQGGITYAEPEQKMKPVNKAFLANTDNVKALQNTLAPSDINPADYKAIYFVGGKTMWDFPNSQELAKLTAEIYEANGVVGAVCHGPAALVNVKLSNGKSLIAGKKISSFTDKEEELFGKTKKSLPFLLQERLTSLGANFIEAPAMLEQVVVDGRLVTGQNPLSTYSVAEEMVKKLGKIPPARSWDNMSYTLAVVRAIILQDVASARHFQKTYADQVSLEERLFLEYSTFAFNGYLGEVAQNRGLALLEYAAVAFPKSAKSHEALAEAYHKKGKSKEAMASIDRSLSIEPGSESAQKLKKQIKE
jgi:putative intracellular protease/amidase